MTRSVRLFPELPPRAAVPPFPADLGLVGGPMDGGYGHINNMSIPAGYTYFAQFVAHDLTLGDVPSLRLRALYGDGPAKSPALYDVARPGFLRTGPVSRGGYERTDLPRDDRGTALLGDPRNDHTTILAQVHATFLTAHNHLMMMSNQRWEVAFHESQYHLRQLYQRLIVRDLMPRLVGAQIVEWKLATREFRTDPTCLPVEFTLAVGRFGHAMVQPRYRLNNDLDRVVFRENGGVRPFDDLRGQPLAANGIIEWDNFFPIGDKVKVQASSKLNTKICRPLFLFPIPGVRDQADRSIPYRTLVSGQRTGLPSGQHVAIALKREPLTEEVLWGALPFVGQPAPLWFYVLREAETQQHGRQLGSVGAEILADVILAVLSADPESFLVHNRENDHRLDLIRSVGELFRWRHELP